jgi:hypothetical protein
VAPSPAPPSALGVTLGVVDSDEQAMIGARATSDKKDAVNKVRFIKNSFRRYGWLVENWLPVAGEAQRTE